MLDIADEHQALIQFLYHAPVGLAQTSIDGEIALINPISAQLLMPLSRDGSLDNLFTALEGVAPDLRSMTARFTDRHGMVCDGLQIQLTAGVRGQSDPQILSLSLLKLDEFRLMAILNDVTQQVKRERLLRQQDAWFSAILTGITDYALVSLDGHGRVDDWNPSVGRVTGFQRAAVLGEPYSIFFPPDAITPDRMLDRLRDADDNGWSLDNGWRIRADGTSFWGSAMIVPLRDRYLGRATGTGPAPLRISGEPAYCLVIRDITDKRAASETLRHATACDFLTGLSNRRALFEAGELELERWRRAPRPLSAILFDVDHFKRVNDNYGHAAGDVVLRHLAATLTATFRQLDVVARMGGEEFAVLLPSTGLAAAAAVAERLRQAVESQTVEVDGGRIQYTVSGGVALMSDGLAGLDALLKRADHALYAAKTAGRNRIECAA
jgi:diguanylate cyclase (GGDEF)-like protein/PAS domain S-box-containing protein